MDQFMKEPWFVGQENIHISSHYGMMTRANLYFFLIFSVSGNPGSLKPEEQCKKRKDSLTSVSGTTASGLISKPQQEKVSESSYFDATSPYITSIC